MEGRPDRAGWVVQWRVTSRWCHRRIVAGVTSNPSRRRVRKRSGKRGDQGSVGPADPRSRSVPSEYCELVAQDEVLDLLGY